MGNQNAVRHKVRRKLAQCAELCDNIQMHLASCAQPFEESNHPAHEGFVQLGQAIEMNKQLIESFREKL